VPRAPTRLHASLRFWKPTYVFVCNTVLQYLHRHIPTKSLCSSILFTDTFRQLSTIESVTLTRCALTHAQLGALVPLLLRCTGLKCVDVSHNRLGESRAAADWERLATLVEVHSNDVQNTASVH